MKDGGSAFPYTVETPWAAKAQAAASGHPIGNTSVVPGMSLRDYFAAKAMQAFIAGGVERHPDFVVSDAYAMADAMLAVRGES